MYVKNIEFLEEDGTGSFVKGDKLELNENIVLLVGEQGVGKSTLLKILQHQSEITKINLTDLGNKGVDTFYFDTEKMNPRVKDPQLYSTASGEDEGIGYISALKSRFRSHGQVLIEFTVNAIQKADNAVIFLDEPESALSIRNQIRLVNEIHQAVKRSCQFIIATHNYYLINSVEKVLSLDNKSWISSKDYLNVN